MASGHARRLGSIAQALAARGWRITFVEPDNADVRLDGRLGTVRTMVAPVQLAAINRAPPRHHASHADVLEQFGLGSASFVLQRMLLWDAMLRETDPDLVVSDNSPCLNLACHGRVDLVPVGNAITLPPADLPSYPLLRRTEATVPEEGVVQAINRACAHLGRPPLDRLPQVYRGRTEGCIALDFLDPYAASRRVPALPTRAPPPTLRAAGRQGGKVVLYLTRVPPRVGAALIDGLVLSGLPARAVMPFAEAEERRRAREGGLEVHDGAVPLDLLVRDARLALGVATPGFASDMAWLGIPQVAVGTDIERHVNAAMMARHGIARRVLPAHTRRPDAIADAIRGAYEDIVLSDRSLQVAAELEPLAARDPFETLADRIESV